MKKNLQLILSILFFILLNNLIISQTSTSAKDSITSLFIGKWYLRNSFPAIKDSLILEKDIIFPGMEKVYFEIKPNGEFIDVFDFPGGEESINHVYNGEWTFDLKTMEFDTSVPACDVAKFHKLRLDGHRLILKNLKLKAKF